MKSRSGRYGAYVPQKLKRLLVLMYRASMNDGNVKFGAIWKFMLKNRIDYKTLAKRCDLTEKEITDVLFNATKDEKLIAKVAHYMEVEPSSLMIRPAAES